MMAYTLKKSWHLFQMYMKKRDLTQSEICNFRKMWGLKQNLWRCRQSIYLMLISKMTLLIYITFQEMLLFQTPLV